MGAGARRGRHRRPGDARRPDPRIGTAAHERADPPATAQDPDRPGAGGRRHHRIRQDLHRPGARAGGSHGDLDIVVGADGVYSKVRRHVLDEDLRPRYIGQSAFRLNIPREPEIDRIVLQKGAEGMAGFVPIGPDTAYLFYNTTWRQEQDDVARVLRDSLAPFGGLTGRIRDRHITDSSAIVFRPEEWLIAPAPWHKGRIVLIGDAVHAVTPHLGQGAAQAIEDGVVLAECLATEPSIEEAFRAYTGRRYERCKLIVEASVQIGEWEMDPGSHPGFDHADLTQHVLQEMVKPI
ncbi:FAD-dependent monooxygenase [Actinoplanes sp. CA-054009]